MRLLVTRPATDAAALGARLAALGHTAILAPLLTIAAVPGPPLALSGVQAILLTSANGARALARRTARRDIAVFAVGDQTAAAAEVEGFTAIASADGDVAALAALVRSRLDPAGGSLIHVAGETVAGDLGAALGAHGFVVARHTLYRAQACDRLPEAAAEALRAAALNGALFFSPRSARIFARLVGQAGLDGAAASITAFCLSAAVGEALHPLAFARVVVAPHPTLDALLRTLPPAGAQRQSP